MRHTHARPRIIALLLLLGTAACGGGGGPPLPPAPSPPEPPPALAFALEPASGPIEGGTRVHVAGSGFPTDGVRVFVLFGTRAAEATVLSDLVLEVTVPPGDAPGPVDVALAGPGGTESHPGAFTYEPSPPVLTFFPVEALAGTAIEITVTNFPALGASPLVTFDEWGSPSARVLGPDRLRATVPPQLVPGRRPILRVTDGASVSADGFRVSWSPVTGDLVVNEFLPDPGVQDANRDGTASTAGDEFVEIVNLRATTLDLTGCTISDAAQVRHRFPNATTVPGGGAIVVFGFGNPADFAPRHASGHAQSASTGSLGLNNTNDSIEVRDPSGLVLFHLDYVTADVAAGRSRQNPVDGRSISTPAGSSSYVLHEYALGASGSLSPGLRASGTPFP